MSISPAAAAALKSLQEHTNKPWVVKEDHPRQITLEYNGIFINSMPIHGKWKADFFSLSVEDVESGYRDTPLEAYDELKANVKDLIDTLTETFSTM